MKKYFTKEDIKMGNKLWRTYIINNEENINQSPNDIMTINAKFVEDIENLEPL